MACHRNDTNWFCIFSCITKSIWFCSLSCYGPETHIHMWWGHQLIKAETLYFIFFIFNDEVLTITSMNIAIPQSLKLLCTFICNIVLPNEKQLHNWTFKNSLHVATSSFQIGCLPKNVMKEVEVDKCRFYMNISQQAFWFLPLFSVCFVIVFTFYWPSWVRISANTNMFPLPINKSLV